MKTEYILVWETEDHQTKVKTADDLGTLYMYQLEHNVTGKYYKQVTVGVVEK